MRQLDHQIGAAYTAGVLLTAKLASRNDDPREDHFVVLRGVSWSDYERVMKLRGDGSVPRLAYEKGVLELMSPSVHHESIKSWIGRLVEVWCDVHDVEFQPVGSWTLKNKRKETGVEPDESYVFGDRLPTRHPDLAIEVIWTAGGIDKRDLYRRIGVPEVWFWRKGRISVHALRSRGYEEVARSEVLPGIDLAELASFLRGHVTSKAMRAYRAALRKKKRA
jgi:Uma2 family endonuclease